MGRIEQQIRSPGQFHIVLFGEFVCAVRPVADLQVFGLLNGRRIRIVFDGEGLHTEPSAAVGQQFHRRFVDQVAVLDASDPGFDGPRYAPGIVNVHHYVRAPVFGRPHRRADLLFEKFGYVQRIVERCRAAAGHQFDLRGSLPQVFARRRRDGIGTVDNARGPDLLDVGHFAAAARMTVFVDHPEVAVSRRLGAHGAAGIDSRALQDAGVDGPFESENGASRIPDGRETP